MEGWKIGRMEEGNIFEQEDAEKLGI